VRLAWVIFLAPVLLAGCFLGADPLPPGTGDQPDARPDAPPPPPDAPPPPMCKDATNTLADGHHNPGLDCMSGNCHGPTGSGVAPKWTVAGTLYAAPTGPTIVKYATISIEDAAGTKLDLVTSLNGNFYTGQILQFPIKVYASKCPAIQVMSGTPQYGSCNACHQPGTGPGQMNLPPQ
jgi:hypothetical protein